MFIHLILLLDETDDVIEDEDEPWKRKKNSYYRQHFCPESDPTITKFTVSVKYNIYHYLILSLLL